MTQLVFEKRVSSAWMDVGTMSAVTYDFNEAFRWCVREFHSWPALIVGCHLDETTPIAEFFVIEGGVHAEYRLREVGGND